MRKTALALLLAAVLVPVVSPASSYASYDPIGQGTLRLSFEKSFLSFLRHEGIKLSARAPAKLRRRTLILPAAGGRVDPTAGLTTTETEGALVFTKGKRSLPLRELVFKANPNPLQAKVGGGQLKVATSKRPKATRAGFAANFKATALELTAKVATRLNKKLRLRDAFAAGQALGTLKAKVSPLTTTVLPQGRAMLVPDPAMLAKLESLFVSLNPIAPAELAPGPILSLPIIAGGELAPDGSQGTLRTGGEMELLQLHGGQVFEREFWFDLGLGGASTEPNIQPSPPYAGKQGRLGAFAIDMRQAAISSDPKARTISVANAPLALTDATAAAFNEAFASGEAEFSVGERFGVVSFTAQGQ